MNNQNFKSWLCFLLFFIPLYIFIIGNDFGSGIQWQYFVYKSTVFGDTITIFTTDLSYVVPGILTGKSALPIIIRTFSGGILFLAFFILVSNYDQYKNWFITAGIMVVFAGILNLIAIFIQYGLTLNGHAGVALPLGIPLMFIIGFWIIKYDSSAPQ